ncbi:MAG: hypothetical protein F4Y80_09895 [Caldilineaceae bacterium SB0665_bin_21]|nr:hypothetical protein [Caldilineaceae bacterium SB0665_bin_21]MYA03512.1 hypothetical protein [Caldilineaceae bacterium SB0664_bin_22]
MSELITALALGMMSKGVFVYREPTQEEVRSTVSPFRAWLGSVLITLGRRVQPNTGTHWTGMREAAL